jgi:hypothetical protein
VVVAPVALTVACSDVVLPLTGGFGVTVRAVVVAVVAVAAELGTAGDVLDLNVVSPE